MAAVTAVGFDTIAAEYDRLWNRTPVGASQRSAVWHRVDPLFPSGSRLLDIGCGTGEDALHFQSRGVNVYAIDASSQMIHLALSRRVNAHHLSAEELDRVPGVFDGALSNFGVLNCLEHLDEVSRKLACVIRPGGYAALCVMGPCCAWEVCHYLRRVQIRKAFRRFRRGMIPTSIGVDVRYPSARQMRKSFEPDFKLIRWYGIGLCVPPSYVSDLSDQTVSTLANLDSRLAHRRPFRNLADHRLYMFQRV